MEGDTSGGQDPMEYLVDAFRGLATGNRSGCRQEVETIVNAYFTKGGVSRASSPPRGVSPQRPQPPSPQPRSSPQPLPSPQRVLSPIEDLSGISGYSFASTSTSKPLAHPPARGSPTKGRFPSPIRHNRSASSSGSALRAWTSTEQEQLAMAVAGLEAQDESGDIYTRSVGWRRRQDEARSKMRVESKERETEQCTWKPSINTKKAMQKRREHLRVEDRLQAAAALRDERLRAEREKKREAEVEGCTFHPNINHDSVAPRYLEGVGSARSKSPPPADCTFAPSTNKSTTSTRYLHTDPFERLYRAGQAKKEFLQEGETADTRTTPVFYTTYNPANPPKKRDKTGVRRNLSSEEIEATEAELAEIERLLNDRLKKREYKAAEPQNFQVDGKMVDSNYIDSDDEEADRVVRGRAASVPDSSRTLIDFDSFLIRQNMHEERRRANLAFLEADTAPKLHPRIEPRSKRLLSKSKKTGGGFLERQEGSERVVSGLVGQREERLRKLARQYKELRGEMAKMQEDCVVLVRQLHVAKELPQARDGSREGTVGQLHADLNSLKGWRDSKVLQLPSGDLRVRPADQALAAALASYQPDEGGVMKKGTSLDKLFARAQKENPEQYPTTLQQWVRDMIEVRNGLMEVRVRLVKICDALEVEKRNIFNACGGAVPWDKLAQIEFRRESAPNKVEQSERPEGARVEGLQPGDAVLVRREEWQKWSKGVLRVLDDGRAEVLEEGKTKPQSFPATTRHLRRAPQETHPFQPDIRAERLMFLAHKREVVELVDGVGHTHGRVLAKGEAAGTWEVQPGKLANGRFQPSRTKRLTVRTDDIRLSEKVQSEHYGPLGLENYIQQLNEEERRREEKREKAQTEREQREEAECTHVPQINSAPEYITRIAHSMAILRGERQSPPRLHPPPWHHR